jgi:hypothetical protein
VYRLRPPATDADLAPRSRDRRCHAAERQRLALQPGLPTNRRERQREYGFGPITTVPADVSTSASLTSGLSSAHSAPLQEVSTGRCLRAWGTHHALTGATPQLRETSSGFVRYSICLARTFCSSMASRLFALIALLLMTAGIAAFLVAAGWIPWTYPVIAVVVGLIVWGFVALRRTRRPTLALPTSARGGRPGLELWDAAGRTINENPGKR